MLWYIQLLHCMACCKNTADISNIEIRRLWWNLHDWQRCERLKGVAIRWDGIYASHIPANTSHITSKLYYEYNIILIKGLRLMTFYNIWRIYSWIHSGHNCSCISSEACVIGLSLTWDLSFVSASLYVSKRGAYWDRLCRDVVGWLVVTRVHCGQTVHPRPIVTMEH